MGALKAGCTWLTHTRFQAKDAAVTGCGKDEIFVRPIKEQTRVWKYILVPRNPTKL